MRETLRDQGRLRHILIAIDNITRFIEGKTSEVWGVTQKRLAPLKEQMEEYLKETEE